MGGGRREKEEREGRKGEGEGDDGGDGDTVTLRPFGHPISFLDETVFLLHLVGHLDVFGHGVFLGHGALESVPGVPLGLALEVEHAGSLGVAVADRGLLEVLVQLQKLLVAQRLVHLLVHHLHSFFELGRHFLLKYMLLRFGFVD